MRRGDKMDTCFAQLLGPPVQQRLVLCCWFCFPTKLTAEAWGHGGAAHIFRGLSGLGGKGVSEC